LHIICYSITLPASIGSLLSNRESVFANPAGSYSGKLIEEAGLKGSRAGAAQISAQHANFIVNVGGASAADVAALIREAHTRVREQFGVDLELEVELRGEWKVKT